MCSEYLGDTICFDRNCMDLLHNVLQCYVYIYIYIIYYPILALLNQTTAGYWDDRVLSTVRMWLGHGLECCLSGWRHWSSSCHEVLGWAKCVMVKIWWKIALDWSWSYMKLPMFKNGGFSRWRIHVVFSSGAQYDKVTLFMNNHESLSSLFWFLMLYFDEWIIFINEHSIFIHIHILRSLEVIATSGYSSW